MPQNPLAPATNIFTVRSMKQPPSTQNVNILYNTNMNLFTVDALAWYQVHIVAAPYSYFANTWGLQIWTRQPSSNTLSHQTTFSGQNTLQQFLKTFFYIQLGDSANSGTTSFVLKDFMITNGALENSQQDTSINCVSNCFLYSSEGTCSACFASYLYESS